jgi:hypothetical protein
MRCALALIALGGTAHADVLVGGSVGAGGRGEAAYSALELRLDGAWDQTKLGLGARGVWLDGELRTSDWDGWPAIRVLRLFETRTTIDDTTLAIAAGGLAPAELGHVADGYRATLDDRPRTGVRAFAASQRVLASVEIDDVVEPHLIGGALEIAGDRWVGCGAVAIDPEGIGAGELCGARRWAREGARLDLGAGVTGERLVEGGGGSALGFVRGALDRGGARWTANAELRAGSGSVGAAFGPLHRIEESVERTGVGAAAAVGVAGVRGWARAAIRWRPELGALGTLQVGAPAGKWFQIAGWIAATERHGAGAAELRITWAKSLASAIEFARIYDVDAMQPAPLWTATAWFAIQQAPRRTQ